MARKTKTVAEKIAELEKTRKARESRRRKASTKLVSAPPKRRARRKPRPKTKAPAGPVTLRKVPRNYEEAKALYGTPWYKEWRLAVFNRDGFVCQMCGKRAKLLECHHIRPKYQYPALTLDKDNGITLCKFCHQDRVTRHEHRFIHIFDRIVKLNKSGK